MKKLLVVFLMGIFAASVFGQAIPENSNTIILSASDSVQAKATVLKVEGTKQKLTRKPLIRLLQFLRH